MKRIRLREKVRQWLCACGIFFAVSAGWTQAEALDVSAHPFSLDPTPGILYAVDPEGTLTLEQVVGSSELAWQSVPSETLNLGFQSEPVWLRLPLENRSTEDRRELILEVGYPLLDSVDFHVIRSNGEIESFLMGDLRPFEQRPIAHRHFLLPLTLQAGEGVTVLVRIESTSALQLPLTLADPVSFFSADQQELIGHAFYYGLLTVLVLINLCLWMYLRQAVYLYYVLFVSSIAGFQFVFHGLPAVYLGILPSGFPDQMLLLLVPTVVLSVALFTNQFLRLERTCRWLHRLLMGTACFSLFCMAASVLLPYETSMKLSLSGVVLISLVCLVAGPYQWYRGYKAARLYTFAWACLILAALLIAMNKVGMLPRTFVTENGLQLGSALEALLLSLALADRLHREREERYRAQEQALDESRQRQLVEERLMQTALHHPLTGLPNRPFFENWFALNQQDLSPPRKIMLGIIHLSRFDEVRKTLGHRQADELLRLLVRRLARRAQGVRGLITLRDRKGQVHTLANLDDMTLAFMINTEINTHAHESIHHLVQQLVEPIEFMGMLIDVGGIAGVASYPTQGVDAPTLIQNAQIAIDMGRRNGNPVTPYHDEINPYSARRLSLAGELRKAINRNHLELYFQPKVCAADDQVIGMEALLRWNHPVHGMVSPDEFIRLAEQTGIIHPLTEWVLEEAVSKLRQLQNGGHDLAVSVNISAINLKEKRLAEMVGNILAHHGVEPGKLVLEVTETAMMDDPERGLAMLRELHALGVRLSIDDFGTGYSSLNYIKRLPVHEIKIDRSFVMEMDTARGDAIIVRTTVNMCHDLGLTVVAEGVETNSTRQTLQKMGCDYLQGYYLSRPLPFNAFLEWLEEGTVKRFAS